MWRPQVFKHPKRPRWYVEYAESHFNWFNTWEEAYEFANNWARGLPIDWHSVHIEGEGRVR